VRSSRKAEALFGLRRRKQADREKGPWTASGEAAALDFSISLAIAQVKGRGRSGSSATDKTWWGKPPDPPTGAGIVLDVLTQYIFHFVRQRFYYLCERQFGPREVQRQGDGRLTTVDRPSSKRPETVHSRPSRRADFAIRSLRRVRLEASFPGSLRKDWNDAHVRVGAGDARPSASNIKRTSIGDIPPPHEAGKCGLRFTLVVERNGTHPKPKKEVANGEVHYR